MAKICRLLLLSEQFIQVAVTHSNSEWVIARWIQCKILKWGYVRNTIKKKKKRNTKKKKRMSHNSKITHTLTFKHVCNMQRTYNTVCGNDRQSVRFGRILCLVQTLPTKRVNNTIRSECETKRNGENATPDSQFGIGSSNSSEKKKIKKNKIDEQKNTTHRV